MIEFNGAWVFKLGFSKHKQLSLFHERSFLHLLYFMSPLFSCSEAWNLIPMLCKLLGLSQWKADGMPIDVRQKLSHCSSYRMEAPLRRDMYMRVIYSQSFSCEHYSPSNHNWRMGEQCESWVSNVLKFCSNAMITAIYLYV